MDTRARATQLQPGAGTAGNWLPEVGGTVGKGAVGLEEGEAAIVRWRG